MTKTNGQGKELERIQKLETLIKKARGQLKDSEKELNDLMKEVNKPILDLQGELNEIELDTIQLQSERSGLEDEVEIGLMTEEEAEERRQEIDESCQDNEGEMELLKIRMDAAREEGQKRVRDFHKNTMNLIKGRLQRWEAKLKELRPDHELVEATPEA